MPKLSTVKISDRPQKILVYGEPKSGKSELVGELAEMGYNLHWMDCENGADVLFKLSQEAQERITLYSIRDNKVQRSAIRAAMTFADMLPFTVCHEHGEVNCSKCKASKAPVDSFDPSTLGPKDVVVWDSLSQISISSVAQLTRKENLLDVDTVNYKDTTDFSLYNAQGKMLDAFGSAVQTAPFKVVCISHVSEIEKKDNPRGKGVNPLMGTKNKSKTSSKFYSHVVYTYLKNNKHCVMSSTTKDMAITAGSRTDIDVSVEPRGLAALFEKVGVEQVAPTNAGEAKKTLVAAKSVVATEKTPSPAIKPEAFKELPSTPEASVAPMTALQKMIAKQKNRA